MFLPRLVPLGFVLAAWVAALSVVLFFSPVRPRHLACFSLGSFLCFLVRGSSLLGPFLLFFSPLCVSCPFLGDLPAISRSVSSSGEDLFLSSLPDVRAMAESSSNPLPRSFRVLSFHVVWVLFRLHSFCALFVNPSCLLWLAIPSRPRFLSSRSLAQIALSFFIRDIISQASSSTSSSSLPISASSSLRVPCVLPFFSAALCSRCCGFCGFCSHCFSFLPLESATYSLSSVFTSFSLRVILFSSCQGFHWALL